jgi:hypothetical protein
MNKHSKISKLLRYFMRRRGNPSHYACVRRNKKGTGNSEPAKEIMNGVTNEYQIGDRLPTMRGSSMRMVPVEKLFQGEKYREATYQPNCRYEGRKRRCTLGNHVKESAPKQRSCSEGHQGQEHAL